jgi:hypothetical protein
MCQLAHLENFFAENAHDLVSGNGILLQKIKQFVPGDEVKVGVPYCFSRQAIRFPGKGGWMTYKASFTQDPRWIET